MRKLAFVISLLLTACGGSNESDCTVINNDNGTATVSCKDGSHFLIENGQDGIDGANGTDGTNCTVVDNDNGTATITCPDGSSATIGTTVQDGMATLQIITSGAWGEVFVDGVLLGTYSGASPFAVEVDITVDNTISFGSVYGYNKPFDIELRADTLVAGSTNVYNGGYTLRIPACYRSFLDVECDMWFFDYVEELVDQGIFSPTNFFRPADSLNRAELVKMVIIAIDGLADYEAPATPTFDDVPVTAWYFDYIECAVQLGIVSGYTDASGNLTGMFGPGDTVNRAATVKWLVNSFAVPTTLSPASPFSDVTPSAWFHDYVVTAYNQSIVDGYDNGAFGPADPVTRAQIAKWLINAMDPVLRLATVTITDNGPAAATVSPGTNNVAVQDIGLTTGANLMVRDTRIAVSVWNDSGMLVDTSEEAAYGALKALRVVDIDTGATLQGPITWVTDADRYEMLSGQVWYEKVFTEDYNLVGGDTRHLSVRVDVDATFPSGYSFSVVYSLVPGGAIGSSYVKDMALNVVLPADYIVGDPVMSNRVTVQ